MFSKMKMVATATAIAGAVALGGAATASAGTAVVTSGGAVTATSASARLVVNNAVALNCTSSSASATVPNGTYTGTPAIVSSNLLVGFQNCTGPLGFAFTVTCTSTAQLGVTGNTASGISAGVVRNISCVVTFPAIACSATVTGSVTGSYNNAGTLTVNAPGGQTLTVSGSGCPSVLPNGTAVFGGTGSGALGVSNLTYNLGTVKPQIAASGF